MTTIRSVGHDDVERVVDAAEVSSMMRIAVNTVPGLLAECGGNQSCSTGHGYRDEADFDRPPRADEGELIEFMVEPPPTCHLTGVVASPELDGMDVRWLEAPQ